MFDSYYCIKSFYYLKTLKENASKSCFCITIMKHEGFLGFENAFIRVKSNLILTSLNYVNIYASFVCLTASFLATGGFKFKLF